MIIADQYRDIVGDRPATKIIQLCVSFFLFVVSVSVGVFFLMLYVHCVYYFKLNKIAVSV